MKIKDFPAYVDSLHKKNDQLFEEGFRVGIFYLQLGIRGLDLETLLCKIYLNLQLKRNGILILICVLSDYAVKYNFFSKSDVK